MGRLDLRDPWRDEDCEDCEDYETSFPPLRATDDHDDDRYYEDLTMVPMSLHGPESQSRAAKRAIPHAGKYASLLPESTHAGRGVMTAPGV